MLFEKVFKKRLSKINVKMKSKNLK